MKKLFAFILLLTALSVGCIFPTLSTFAMSSVDSSVHEGMEHDMSWHEWMGHSSENDSENMHKCCESPFIDSLNPTALSQDDFDIQNDNAEIDYALLKSVLENNSDRLNSPPDHVPKSLYIVKNDYASLTGIIKNNR